MKIGFLFNTFHSEVLDFLLELATDQGHELIVYNDTDNYDNMSIYEKKYKFTKKRTNDFLHDTVNGNYDKVIVITHSNLFSLSLIEKYNERFIFIAHSEKDMKQLEEKNYKYITLTQLLSLKGDNKQFNKNLNWMLPITKTTTEDKNYDYDSTRDLEDNDTYLKRQVYIRQNNLKPIMMIGHFMYNNKNIEIIKKLLKTETVYLFIFAPEINECLYELKELSNYVFCGIRWKSREIEKMIVKYDIKNMLFAPSEDSPFWKSQWSGTLCYALSRNLNLIMPHKIAENYKLENIMTTYSSENDINENFTKQIHYKGEEIQRYRNMNYERNEKIMTMILNDNNIKDDNILEFVFEKELEDVILYVNSEEGQELSWIMSNHKKCRVLSFEKDLDRAKEQKNRMIMYNVRDRITIYNNSIGTDKKKDVQIDNLDTDNIDTLIIYNEDTNRKLDILRSGGKFLKEQRPQIVMINKDTELNREQMEKIKNEILKEYNYTVKKITRENERDTYVAHWTK